MTRYAAFAAALLFASPALAQDANSLTATFETSARTGAVMAALFDAATYDSGQPIRFVQVDIATGEDSATFPGLPAGEYALKVFHDVNGNGRMDANPFGQPVEPYGFSNNAVGNMGPARWDQTRFTVSGATRQTITLR